MTIEHLDVTFAFSRGDGDARPFDEFLDSVLDELEAIGLDADYTAQGRGLIATFSLPMTGDGGVDDVMLTITSLRTALHAAACSTAGWEEFTSAFVRASTEAALTSA